MPKHDFIEKIDFEDVILSMEKEIKKLEERIERLEIENKTLRHFGEQQVLLNSKQGGWLKSLRDENEKLSDHIKILSC